jgi:hypothetical protein
VQRGVFATRVERRSVKHCQDAKPTTAAKAALSPLQLVCDEICFAHDELRQHWRIQLILVKQPLPHVQVRCLDWSESLAAGGLSLVCLLLQGTNFGRSLASKPASCVCPCQHFSNLLCSWSSTRQHELRPCHQQFPKPSITLSDVPASRAQRSATSSYNPPRFVEILRTRQFSGAESENPNRYNIDLQLVEDCRFPGVV